MTSYRSDKKLGFTLTELLVVIAIIGLLITMLVPSFSGLGRGAKMSSGVNQVDATLSLARQWAITKREKTFVVFPDEATVGNDTNQAEKAFRSYNVYGERSKYLGEWKYLPEGVIFCENSNTYATGSGGHVKDTTCIFSDHTVILNQNKTPIMNLPFPDNSSPVARLRVIGFSSIGAGIQTNTPAGATIYMAEGWVPLDASGAVQSPLTLKYRGNIATNRLIFGMRMNELTGHIETEDYRNK